MNIFYIFFRAYLKPLLRLLKKQTVTDDVMDSLVRMVVFSLQREYILSHEKYMEMAVGNAPWPIGKMKTQKMLTLRWGISNHIFAFFGELFWILEAS